MPKATAPHNTVTYIDYNLPVSKHIHFIGIGGSGMSAIAQIAQNSGFEVDGCDTASDTPYLDKVKKAGIKTFVGHDPSHLHNVDLVAVTPAMFYQNNDTPELVEARNKGIMKKWQDFMGQDLHQGKFVICVAGTHGKSTTTALAGLLLEQADLDPTVEVGATVKDWHNNIRLGQGKYFVSEADEFDDNFATYRSDVIILTMIELDHPEYFGTIDKMLECYQKFINHLKPNGLVIYNSDSPLIHKLKLPKNSISYTLSEFPQLSLSQPGLHNRQNALAILKLANYLKIDSQIAFSVLTSFQGLGRRLDFLGEKNGIKVYDDYANHPSSFAATLQALHEKYPYDKIIAVIEPHTFSRLRALLSELPESLKLADQVIVSKIFASREQDPGNFTGQDIANVIPNSIYIPEFSDIVNHVKSRTKSSANHALKKSRTNHVFIVMGSGNSHLLSRQILESL